MVSAMAAKVLGAVFKIPLTNMLGGVGMSYFSCAYSIFLPVYAFSVTGLSTAVATMTAKSYAFGMEENIRRIRRTAQILFSLVGIAGSLLIFLLAKPFSYISSGGVEAALAVAMIAPSVFFGCITAVERGYYEGMGNMYPTAVSQVAEGVIRVGAGLWLCGYVSSHGDELLQYFSEIGDIRALAAAAGILGVTLSSVGGFLFFAVMGIFSAKKKKEGGRLTCKSSEIASELIKTAFPIGAGSLVTNLTALIDMATIMGCIALFGYGGGLPANVENADIPQFVYGSFSGIALTVFNLVPSVTNMLGKGILPCIASSWAAGDKEGLGRHTAQALLTAAVIAIPAAVGMGVLSPQILHILFARQRDEAELCVGALRWLMPGMVCLCMSFPVFAMLQGIGKSSSPLKIMLIGTAAKAVGNLVFIPFMGINGAALSTSLCYAVILWVSLGVYFRATGISLSAKPFAVVAYAGFLCGVSAFLGADICGRFAGNMTSAVVATVFGGGVYFAAMLIMRN